MKSPFRNALIRLVFLLAVVGIFYVAGQRYGIRHAKAILLAEAKPATPLTPQKSPPKAYPPYDPAKDVTFLNAPPLSPNEKDHRFAVFQHNINPRNIPELVKAISELPASRDNNMMMQQLLFTLAETNPTAALAQIGNLLDAGVKNQVIRTSLQRLSMRNPQQAVRDLEKLPPEADDPSIYTVVFDALAHSDLPAAQAAATSLPAGPDRETALQGVGLIFTMSDPQGAIKWAQSLASTDPDLFGNVVATVGRGGGFGYSKSNPQLAASYLDEVTDPTVRNQTIKGISASLAMGPSQDPAAALDWLNQVATGDVYGASVSNIFSGLVESDSAAGTAFLDKVTDPAALNKTVANWLKEDPTAAVAYVQGSADPTVFLPIDPALALALAVSNPQAALTFADSLPAGDEKNQALENVLVSMAETDFAAAWTDAAALPATDNPVGIMTDLVSVLANKDPAQAAGLIAQFPAGTAQEDVAGAVAATWVKLDPPAFTVWLNSLPPGDVRDTAIAQLVASSQAAKNPGGVLEWVNTVSDPRTKAALLQQLNQVGGSGG